MSVDQVKATCPNCGKVEVHTVDDNVMVAIEEQYSPSSERKRNAVVRCSGCGHDFSVRF